MTSCQSVRVEYKYVVPDVEYPQFPIIDRVVNEDGSWTITKKSADALAVYYTEIQVTEKTYREIKRLLEKGEKQ